MILLGRLVLPSWKIPQPVNTYIYLGMVARFPLRLDIKHM